MISCWNEIATVVRSGENRKKACFLANIMYISLRLNEDINMRSSEEQKRIITEKWARQRAQLFAFSRRCPAEVAGVIFQMAGFEDSNRFMRNWTGKGLLEHREIALCMNHCIDDMQEKEAIERQKKRVRLGSPPLRR